MRSKALLACACAAAAADDDDDDGAALVASKSVTIGFSVDTSVV